MNVAATCVVHSDCLDAEIAGIDVCSDAPRSVINVEALQLQTIEVLDAGQHEAERADPRHPAERAETAKGGRPIDRQGVELTDPAQPSERLEPSLHQRHALDVEDLLEAAQIAEPRRVSDLHDADAPERGQSAQALEARLRERERLDRGEALKTREVPE